VGFFVVHMPTRLPRKSKPSIPSPSPPRALFIARTVVKTFALSVGGTSTFLGLMAVLGLAVQSGWIRVLVTILVMLVIPAVIVDRVLPENTDAKAKGLTTDVFSLAWLGSALLLAVALHTWTKQPFRQEGDRLRKAGYVLSARAAYFLAGVEPKHPETETPKGKNSAGAPKRPSPRRTAAPAPNASSSSGVSAPSASTAPDTSEAPETPPESKDPAELFEELAPSVVTVAVKRAGALAGGGTGFLIDSSGTIATNQHVISRADAVRVTFMGGAVFEDTYLLVEDAEVDLALLQVDLAKPDEGEPVDAKPLRLGNSDDLVVGERALSIGNPLGLDHTLTDGLISARRMYEGRRWIQTSVPISPGNSGGPLFNVRGEVVGVTTATLGGMFGAAQNLNLAVPVNALSQLLENNHPERRRFGQGTRSGHW
jgi:S1-C subfamily serine protease